MGKKRLTWKEKIAAKKKKWKERAERKKQKLKKQFSGKGKPKVEPELKGVLSEVEEEEVSK
jgi:hypothetical protein